MTDYIPKSDYLNIALQRGFFHQCSDVELLDKLLLKGGLPGYIGFDCTAKSFHVGNLVQIMRLYWFQQTGNKPIVLMGGGTSRVGDPSGKDATRQLLQIEKIEENKGHLKNTFQKLLEFGSGASSAIMVDNAEWLAELGLVDVLRDVGTKFSVNRMLSMESVKGRIDRDQEMSFIEFNYMILQAYDFVELSRRYGCKLQMGGSDQWGNIVSGIDLGRRMGENDLAALTCDLITTADGKKMGKTAEGAVWLDPDLLPIDKYWKFWRNVDDRDVGRFLRLFTTVDVGEIDRLESLQEHELEEAKTILANEATSLLHGSDALTSVLGGSASETRTHS